MKRDSKTLAMRLLTWIIVVFVLTGGIRSQSSLTFCDLIRSPEKYNGKEVTVRATYRYGFEWSELYCLDCLDQGKAWLDMPTALEDTSAKSLKKMPKGAGIVNLTVQGVFVSGGTFGHSNAYRYKIEPTKISDVAVLQKGMKSPEEEKNVEKRCACGGTNPK
ncbi:MAG: hypothetical protein LAP21_19420 [Acidobacteriia bacterium]|nr:hypothetical protein [Terriglobia bacterium]